MHPYVIDQLARDRWDELQRIGNAANAARRRGRRRRFARQEPAAARLADAPIVDLRDTRSPERPEPLVEQCC